VSCFERLGAKLPFALTDVRNFIPPMLALWKAGLRRFGKRSVSTPCMPILKSLKKGRRRSEKK
jgi:hypothetical protein